jgi:SAM-dependent methyltransferase
LQREVRTGQAEYWEAWHQSNDSFDQATVHAESLDMFSVAMAEIAGSPVLELGCGHGWDAVELASRGYDVTAIDFSATALKKASRLAAKRHVSLDLHAVDLAHTPYPWPADTFFGAFSYLALHYFDDHTTHAIFADLRRILRRQGNLTLVVRSTSDPLYGHGERLGPHLFRHGGHIRHFFNSHYMSELLDGWKIERLEEVDGYYIDRGHAGVFLRVQAHSNKRHRELL